MEKLIEGADYFIRYMNLPPKIWAFCTPNSDGTYSVYLDPRRSYSQQKCDLAHEIGHILRDDFNSNLPVYVCEAYEVQEVQETYRGQLNLL